jgi:hypothetical protein
MYAVLQRASTDCSVKTPNNNLVPTADAGADYIIPNGTAFVLTGTGTDPNGDPLLIYGSSMIILQILNLRFLRNGGTCVSFFAADNFSFKIFSGVKFCGCQQSDSKMGSYAKCSKNIEFLTAC